MFRSIKGKILTFFIAVIIIVLGIMGSVLYFELNERIEPIIRNMTVEIIDARVLQLREWMKGISKETRSIASRDELKSMNWREIKDILINKQEGSKGLYQMMFIADQEGNIQTTNGLEFNISDREYFKEIIAGKDSYVSNAIISRASGLPVFVMVHAIKDESDNLKGIFGATIVLNKGLSDMVNNINIGKKSHSWIVDGKGLIIADAQQDNIMNLNITSSNEYGYKGFEELSQIILQGDSGHGEIVDPNGQQSLVIFDPIPNTAGWSFGISIPKSELLKESNSIIKMVIFIIIIVILIMILVSYLIGNSIAKPIKLLSNKIIDFGEGDLTVDFNIKSKDEIGEMASNLNQMGDNLKRIIISLLNNIEDLSSYSEELYALSEESNATMEINTQKTQDILDHIKEISVSTKEVMNLAQKTNYQTEVGSDTVNNSIENMDTIDQVVEDAVQVIYNLDQKSQEISEIVQLITNIAEQTNLLSLNAAIEAARAGDHGRGFAVVAEEIRSLSEETEKSTGKIHNLVQELQLKSKLGVNTIREVKTRVEEGKEISNQTDSIFKRINTSSQETTHQVEKTQAVTEELSINSEEIREGSKEINAGSKEIRDSSEELSTMAEKLQILVEQFKIK